MKIFHRYISNALVLAIVFFAGIVFSPVAAAQSLAEMDILRLFYTDQELFTSATRHPKPIFQVAENMTVVTSREIEDMNAHTVAEVLNHVPALFVNFNQDFGAASLLGIQGSEQRHVLVLLDGVPWNFLSEGSAETNSIPLGIIERIEIIKGAASSAWGSSLGGVISIVTKPAGSTARPAGTVKASYGERNTRDLNAQVSGLAGPVGYYLFAGRQDSDGLRADREFSSQSLFTKFSIPVLKDGELGLTMGFSKPANSFGEMPDLDVKTASDVRSLFLAASLNASLTPELDLSLSIHAVGQKISQTNDVISAQQLFLINDADERDRGAGGKLVWTRGRHTVVIGMDADRGTLDQKIRAGSYLQSFGVPALSVVDPAVTRRDVYVNDTIAFDGWSLTPGFRYDYNSVAGSFVSPSLGGTLRLGKDTLARASVARGFTQPPLSWASGGGLFLGPNPSLDYESVWSYQAGLESVIASRLWLKGTAFYHDLDHEIRREGYAAGPPTYYDLFVNKGRIRRQGLELEGETVPFHNLSLAAGLTYVHIASSEETKSRDSYTYNIAVKYDDLKSLKAQLLGHYIWWDLDGSFQATYGDWIWDLDLSRKVMETRQGRADVFFAAHNLFNGDQYTFIDSKNPKRWIEAGIKISF